MFILSILVLAITSIILVSLRISARALENAETMQGEWLDPLLREDFTNGIANDVIIDFSFAYDMGVDEFGPHEILIDVEIPIQLFRHASGTWAFRPNGGGGP